MADLQTRIVVTLKDQTGQGLGSVKSGVASVEQQVQRLKTAVLGFLGVSLGGVLVKQIAGVADEYARLDGRLKLATKNQQDFAAAQKAVFDVSQRTRTELGANVDLFAKVNRSLRELGGTQQQAIRTTESINKAIRISGVDAGTARAGIIQFGQALASGVLRGDEFNSVMENTPRLAQALADGLGVTIGQLRGLAEQGDLTAGKVINALESQAEVLDREFASLPKTIDQSLTQLSNAWLRFIGQLNQGAGVTRTVADGFSFLADNLTGVATAALSAGAIIVAALAVKALGAVRAFTGSLLQQAVAQGAAVAATFQQRAAAVASAQATVTDTAARIANTQALLVSNVAGAAKVRLQFLLLGQTQQLAAAETALAAAERARITAGSLVAAGLRALLSPANLVLAAITALFFAWSRGAEEAADKTAALRSKADEVRAAVAALDDDQVNLETAQAQENLDALGAKLAELRQQRDSLRLGALLFDASADELEAVKGQIQQAVDEMAVQGARVLALQERGAKAVAEGIKASFKATAESIKTLGDLSQETLDRLTRGADEALAQRLSAIEAAGLAETEKERQVTAAVLDANRDKLQLAKDFFGQRLQLVERSFADEIAAQKKKGRSTEQLEKESIEQRKKILTDFEGIYEKSIQQLIALDEKHAERAAELTRDRFNLEKSFRDQLAELKGIGQEQQDPDTAVFQERRRLVDLLAQAEKTAGEDKLRLLQEANQLAFDIAKSERARNAEGAANTASVRQGQNDLINTQNLLRTATEQLAQTEQQQSNAAQSEADAQRQALTSVRQEIAQINTDLAQAKALSIQVDDSQLQAVIDKINSIPSTKVVTIVTQTQGDAAPAEQFSAGGPVVGLASGGDFRRLLGRLPGFGGGDKVRALLEPGEFIANKFLVRRVERATGIPDFQAAVRALLDAAVPRFAHGGPALRQSLFGLPEIPRLPSGAGRLKASAAGGGDTIYIGLPDGQKLGPLRAADDSAAAQVRRAALKFGRKI